LPLVFLIVSLVAFRPKRDAVQGYASMHPSMPPQSAYPMGHPPPGHAMGPQGPGQF
jgi:hypothetical protein